jgi:PAS domain S-box-containing protein
MTDLPGSNSGDLQAIFDTTDTIYILLDIHFRIISYNPRAFDFVKNELGHHILVTENFLDYFPYARRQALQDHMTEVLGGRNINYEINYSQPDGRVNWYHTRMYPISRGDGHTYGIMFAVSNITEKKLLQNELILRKVQEQKNVTKAILKAQEIERNKIGQELHDNVNQLLASIRLCINLVGQDLPTGNELIEKSKEYIDLAIEELRLLSKKQVTPQRKLNLKGLIDGLIGDLNASARPGVKFRSEVATHLHIEEDLKLNIYRIVQEQINNVLKHAGASEVSVVIALVDGTLVVAVTDNGKGFNPSLKRKGIGINNMINRVEPYNGELMINSRPGKGCRIEVKIPV